VAGEGRGGRSGASVRVRNVTRVLAPLVLLQALGCGATLERKVRRGEYEAVVAEVEGRRRPPTGRVARAYARALVAQGKSDAGGRHSEAGAPSLVGVGGGRAAETFSRRSVQLCAEPSAAEATRRAVLARLVDTVASREVAAEIRRNAPPVAEEPAIGEVERR